MNPRAILERMARRYERADSYRDHGTHRIDGDEKPLCSTFRTEFSRETGLRFRYATEGVKINIDLLADVDGEVRRARGLDGLPATLTDVLGIGAGCTFLTTVVVPPLFYASHFAGETIKSTPEPHWKGWELVEDDSCHVLEVRWRAMSFELFVSEKSSLIRRFRRRGILAGHSESLLQATYHPELVDGAS